MQSFYALNCILVKVESLLFPVPLFHNHESRLLNYSVFLLSLLSPHSISMYYSRPPTISLLCEILCMSIYLWTFNHHHTLLLQQKPKLYSIVHSAWDMGNGWMDGWMDRDSIHHHVFSISLYNFQDLLKKKGRLSLVFWQKAKGKRK